MAMTGRIYRKQPILLLLVKEQNLDTALVNVCGYVTKRSSYDSREIYRAKEDKRPLHPYREIFYKQIRRNSYLLMFLLRVILGDDQISI